MAANMSANMANMSQILAGLPSNGWTTECVKTLFNGEYPGLFNENGTYGLVDSNGAPVSSYLDDPWGITYTVCEQYCNSTALSIKQSFSYQSFASDMTNYLLPWLSLCAQLPYETENGFNDLISFFLAVGSPALATFSLFTAMRNRDSARSKFKEVRKYCSKRSIPEEERDRLVRRVEHAGFFLREAHHVPIGVCNKDSWLHSLTMMRENTSWWEKLEKSVGSSRRGITPSLVAQISMAVISYVLTIIATFSANPGEPSVTLQMTAGSLWLWLVPVIIGWIMVGTQTSESSIAEALTRDDAMRTDDPQTSTDVAVVVQDTAPQEAVFVRERFSNPTITNDHVSDIDTTEKHDMYSFGGLDIRGDEVLKGPIFSYARLFTWNQACYQIEKAFMEAAKRLDPEVRDRSRRPSIGHINSDTQSPEHRPMLVNDQVEKAGPKIIDGDIEYQRLSSFSRSIYVDMVAAVGVALFVQWGTTGPALAIAYVTPTVGVGCRSASYLIYGGLATFVLLCMITSMLFSHQAMVCRQNKRKYNPHFTSWVCFMAVSARLLGQIVAFGNAWWLILSSLLEFVGLFDNCWCQTDRLALNSDAYVVLFASTNTLAKTGTVPWVSGTVGSLLVCIIAWFAFWMNCSDKGMRGKPLAG